MQTRARRLPAAIAIVTLAAAGSAAVGVAQTRPLSILLTNDDGFDAAGLQVMRTALVAAGHTVTVVAPATNMSSSSMSMTSGVIRIERKSDGVWAVYGTPADAAVIGLVHVLKDAPPDLVISGTNAGQNLSLSTNNSGTVSAAIAATRYGVPAIATSAGTGANSQTAYVVAAEVTRQMIDALGASRSPDGKLLPDRLTITMNVPAVPAGQLKGIRWAPLSTRPSYTRVYSETGVPGELRSQLTAIASAGGESDTDLALFNQGYVTLTLLDGDLSVHDAAARGAVTSRLSKLALPQPAAIP